MSVPAEGESNHTKGERRQAKRHRRRHAMQLHGSSLRRIYRDAVLKRLRRGRGQDDLIR